MTTKEFTKAEILDTDPAEIGSEPWRHGRRATFVFDDEDGNSWRFATNIHYDDGWQIGETVTCTKVHLVERKVMRWEPVP